jgi:hypothetical protein
LYTTSLTFIADASLEKEEENDHFLLSLRNLDNLVLDSMVHSLYAEISAGIDCTHVTTAVSRL